MPWTPAGCPLTSSWHLPKKKTSRKPPRNPFRRPGLHGLPSQRLDDPPAVGSSALVSKVSTRVLTRNAWTIRQPLVPASETSAICCGGFLATAARSASRWFNPLWNFFHKGFLLATAARSAGRWLRHACRNLGHECTVATAARCVGLWLEDSNNATTCNTSKSMPRPAVATASGDLHISFAR